MNDEAVDHVDRMDGQVNETASVPRTEQSVDSAVDISNGDSGSSNRFKLMIPKPIIINFSSFYNFLVSLQIPVYLPRWIQCSFPLEDRFNMIYLQEHEMCHSA